MQYQQSANRIIFWFSVYLVLVFNIGYWKNMWYMSADGGRHDWLLLLTMPFFILACMNFCMQILFWPKVHRVLFPLILVLGAGASYAVMTQNIYFNSDMIQNLIQSNPQEASAWISVKFILWVVITGLVPAVAYIRYVCVKNGQPWLRRLLWRLASVLASVLLVAAVAAVGYQSYASFFRNHKGINHQIVPTNFIGASIKTGFNIYDANRPFEPIGQDATRQAPMHERKQLFVIVVGETTRAQNWGLNAGAPDTTPLLRQVPDLINFPEASSCGTSTAISVPCMFSKMSRSNYSGTTAAHQGNLMDILQKVGLYTSWRENDDGCKGVCERIKHINIPDVAQKSQCNSSGCYDMALLEGLQEEIIAMPNDGVIVLHTIGSHGPAYYQRYPDEFKVFNPTCDTNQLQDCSSESLQNTYNNTILYVDYMLNETIKLLAAQEDKDVALWYLSDHGESLGENGMYLHAAPYAIAPSQQTHIPMIFWANKDWYQDNRISEACLKQRAQAPTSHDNLFHSILGVFDIHTSEYQKDLDIFAGCRT